ncbi:AAA family ATPase [Candidatus Poribacteria bacterium]|nr:AAA family ATPase [Candidatus Poribacteria bacterium]
MASHSRKKRKNPQKSGRQLTKPKQDQAYQSRGMYSSVVIEEFRLFENLKLNGFAKVNIFFGPNNSGKTSILEAIYTHACGFNFVPFLGQVVLKRQGATLTGTLDLGERLITVFREPSSPPYTFTISAKVIGDPSTHIVASTFHPSAELSDLDPRAFGQFSGSFLSSLQTDAQLDENTLQVLDQQGRVLSAQVPSAFLGRWETKLNGKLHDFDLLFPPAITTASPFKLAQMHDILSHRSPNSDVKVFSYLKRYGILPEFAKEMQQIFPEICEIDQIPYPDGTRSPVYIVVSDGQRRPLYAFGDGMRRWFYLLGHMLVNQNSLHCIEEIDATFHPAAHQDLSRLLIRYAEKFKNQLFLTSHSIEFADEFLGALYGEEGVISLNDEDPVRVFTVKPSEDIARPEIWSLSGREAYEMRRNYELELR